MSNMTSKALLKLKGLAAGKEENPKLLWILRCSVLSVSRGSPAVSAWLPPIRVPRRAGPRAASRALEPPAADADAQLKAGIAGFYDGLCRSGRRCGASTSTTATTTRARAGALTLDEHRAAQVRMVDEVLDWAGASASARPREVLDVGCGVGGSSRHLARRFGARATEHHAQRRAGRARAPSAAAGLGGGDAAAPAPAPATAAAEADAAPSCAFAVQDALALPQVGGALRPRVEPRVGRAHARQAALVAQLARACAPRGRVILVTWCHRDLRARERALSLVERALLGVINACYYLPRWCSVADYDALLTAEGLRDVRTADWTPRIAPFWPAVIRTAARPRNALKLLRTASTACARRSRCS